MAELEQEADPQETESAEASATPTKNTETNLEAEPVGGRKKPFLRLAGEALWILLAVLLALGADHWRENQANKKLAKRALEGIIQEMERNRGALGYFLPRHEKLLAELPKDFEDWTPPAMTDESEKFDPVFLRDTAWRTALETQAVVHLDYPVVLELTEVYTFQQAYSELNRDLLRSSFDLEMHDRNRLEAHFHMTHYFLYIFVANEQKLLETYDAALAKIRKK